MSKRKSQTAVDDYRAEGFIREGARQLPRLPRLEPGHRGGGPRRSTRSSRRFDIDKVHKGGARFDRERLEWLNGQWIRRLEPDDLDRPAAAVPRGRGRRRPDRPGAVRRRGPGAPADRPGAAADARARSSISSGSCGSNDLAARPGAARPEALGRGDDPRGPGGGARGRSPRTTPSPGRPTSSSRRSGRWPRRAAGRPATCSWRSASR